MSWLTDLKNYTVIEAIVRTFKEFFQERAFRHSAALSYYTLFSIVPMFLVTIFTCGLIFGENNVEAAIFSRLETALGSDSMIIFKDVIHNLTRYENTSILARIIGILVLVFSSTAVFYSIKTSIHVLWHIPFTEGKRIQSIIDRGLSLLVLMLFGFSIVMLFFIESVLLTSIDFVTSYWPAIEGTTLVIGEFCIGVVTNAVIFALIYTILPNAKLSKHKLFVGTLVNAVLFQIGNLIIAWYLHEINLDSTYGVMGSVMLGVSWVFYSATMIFFGAKFIFVYAELTNDPIQLKNA